MNYYHPTSAGYESEIVNADFFISSQGRTSPEAEFSEFTDTMRSYAKDGSHAAILCSFPARSSLVIGDMPAFKGFSRPDCSKFPRYADPQKVKSISLVFASGYFESPASYFGHTMIKFDTGEKDFNEFFFDSSLNYGAQITDATGTMYIIRGLTGGYTASYQRNNDFINTNSYTNKQMRDVWEYPLQLSPEQKTFMVEYSSELRRARFKYYFFGDNCAHRMARLIDMATNRKMVDTGGPWLLPIQMVQQINHPKDGPTIIKEELRSPSLKSETRRQYLALSPDDQNAVVTFLKSPLERQKQLAFRLSTPALAMAMNYYDVELAKLSTKSKDADKLALLQPHRQIALAERLKRPALSSAEAVPAMPEQGETPATIKHPSYLQAGYTVRSGKDSINLRYQASNNDLLTMPLAGQEASHFIMGAAEVALTEHKLDLSKVTLIDIASLNTNPLPMSLTGEYSWSVKAEYGARNDICQKCSTASLDGKIGKAQRLNENLMLYTLVGGQVNYKETSYNDHLMLTSENGALFTLDGKTRLNTEINADVSPIHGNPGYLFKATLAHDLSSQTDIRFSAENDGENSAATIKFGFYFN